MFSNGAARAAARCRRYGHVVSFLSMFLRFSNELFSAKTTIF